MKKLFLRAIPFTLLFILLSILGRELYSAQPRYSNEAMVGELLPSFSLPLLSDSSQFMTRASLKGKVTLLNFWASWCGACKQEHAMLMKIQRDYGVPIYGVLYKDRPSAARRTLSRRGDPYVAVGNDPNGDVSIDFGIYGTPETYIVSPTGKILYRQVGVIDEYTWNNKMYPIIKQYQDNQ